MIILILEKIIDRLLVKYDTNEQSWRSYLRIHGVENVNEDQVDVLNMMAECYSQVNVLSDANNIYCDITTLDFFILIKT